MKPSADDPHPSQEPARSPAPPPELVTPFLPFEPASPLFGGDLPWRESAEHPAEQTAPQAAEETEELPEASAAALADWKDSLRRDFEAWLEALEEIPEINPDAADPGAHEAPDLYSFFEQLTLANVEARKNNRRTAEAFSQWGETLSKFDADLRLLREQLARQPATKEDILPRSWCLALIEIVDRLHRLAAAFASPPSKSWWGSDAHWGKAWQAQRQGFNILLGHVEALLKQAGLTRIAVLHEPFDPADHGRRRHRPERAMAGADSPR